MALLPGFLLCATILLFRTTFASGVTSCDYIVSDSEAEVARETISYLGLKNSPNVNYSGNPCCWPMVICNNQSNNIVSNQTDGVVRVTWISLSGYGIVGSLPPSIGKFTALEYLYMASNFLTGSIPDSWGNLKNLTILDLNNNNLNGTLDVAGNWTAMSYLFLNSNHFSGEMAKIPMADMPMLTYVLLDDNDFTGLFPDWIGSLSILYKVSLGKNLKMSPSNLPSASSSWSDTLIAVNLSSMNLIGSIPEALTSLPLSMIDLSNNSLAGSLPDNFVFSRPNSTVLLNSNKFTGAITTNFANENLSVLDLSNNLLSGNIAEFFEILCGDSSTWTLTKLNVSQNNLTGEISSSFSDGNCTYLATLDLGHNNLTGAISNFSGLTGLTYLNLDNNKFSGELPTFESEYITTFSVANNDLSGNIYTLLRLPNITDLNLSGNQFSGLLPANTSWAMMETLDLSQNLFNGEITVNFTIEATRLQLLDLSNNNFTGTIPSYLGNFAFLESLDLSNNPFVSGIPDTFGDVDFVYDDSLRIYRPSSFSALLYLNMSGCNLNGTISKKIGNLRRLSALDLSHNQLSGSITDLHETSLVTLDLSDNKLSGELPENLAELPLEALNLSVNYLTGYVPDSFFTFNLTYNLTDCSIYSYIPGNNLFASCVEDKPLPVYAIPIIVAGSMLLIFLAAIAAYFCIFRKKKEHFITRKINEHTVKFVPMQLISEATENFSESNALGAGGFGTVYKGVSKNGELWAVKRANNASIESLEQFKNEVEIISRMNHKNLVKLFGFCHTDTEQILVYEFIENGTLKSALKRKEGTIQPVLTFEQRVDIALGAAEGLRYLHTQAKPTIIHRDVKADNILLDASMQAKVCDFGLLKDNEDKEELAKRTDVAGTYGYMDPEYYSTYRVTAKSDVYSFGVVILELITGREAILEEISGDGVRERISLASWALKMMRSTLGLSAIVDPSLDSNYSLDDMNVLASVAASCLQKVSMYRPEMAVVASHLRLLKTKLENKDSQVMENNGLILLSSEEVVEEEGPTHPILRTNTSSRNTSGTSGYSRSFSNSSFFRPVQKESVLLPR